MVVCFLQEAPKSRGKKRGGKSKRRSLLYDDNGELSQQPFRVFQVGTSGAMEGKEGKERSITNNPIAMEVFSMEGGEVKDGKDPEDHKEGPPGETKGGEGGVDELVLTEDASGKETTMDEGNTSTEPMTGDSDSATFGGDGDDKKLKMATLRALHDSSVGSLGEAAGTAMGSLPMGPEDGVTDGVADGAGGNERTNAQHAAPFDIMVVGEMGKDRPHLPDGWMSWHVPAIRVLVNSNPFGVFMMLMILGNTVVLAWDHHPMDPELFSVLEILNFIFSIIFILELLLKLPGLGWREYKRDAFNLFDAFIVLAGVVELGLAPPSFIAETSGGAGAISAFRVFRVGRIFKLARSWTQLQNVLVVIMNTLAAAGYFAVLLFLFMFIFALMGRQFFANRFHFDVDTGRAIPIGAPNYAISDTTYVPRSNFDSFVLSMSTIFQILTGEDWQLVMLDALRVQQDPFHLFLTGIYFVVLVFVGNYIMLNLFLAIILGNFGTEKKDAADELAAGREPEPGYWGSTALEDKINESNEKAGAMARASAWVASRACFKVLSRSCHADRSEEKAGAKKAFWCCLSRTNPARKFFHKVITHGAFDNTILVFILISTACLALDNPLMDPNSTFSRGLFYMDIILTIIFTLEMLMKIFAKGLIFVPAAYLHDSWNILDYLIVIVSLVALSLSDQWARLAGLPVQGGASAGLSSLRTLRMLRALRPLRMINRAPGLKLVVTALMQSIPSVSNLLVVCFFFFFVFAILSISYLKGMFWHCAMTESFSSNNLTQRALIERPLPFMSLSPAQKSLFVNGSSALFDHGKVQMPGVEATMGRNPCPWVLPSDTLSLGPITNATALPAGSRMNGIIALNGDGAVTSKAVTSKAMCGCFGQNWVPTGPNNFDNIWQALEALFEMSSTEGWVAIMNQAMDTTGLDMQPLRDNTVSYIFYFMAFMVVGHMFTLNMFIGVIIDQFQETKERLNGRGMITAEQDNWIKISILVRRLRPPAKPPAPPPQKCRVPFWRISVAVWFDYFIMTCILVNIGTMCIGFYGMSDELTLGLEIFNMFFAVVYNLEAIIKITGLGKTYFYDGWNIFDFVIVIAANVGIVFKYGGVAKEVAGISTVIRTFRVGRIFRIARQLAGIRRLFNTLLLSLPALGNIGGVILLLYFIYAVVGVQLFSKIAHDPDVDSHFIQGDVVNFRTFESSIVLLFRASTGEAWNSVMHSLKYAPEGCDPDPAFDPDMCGFLAWGESNRTAIPHPAPNGCTPLTGCGSGTNGVLFFFTFTLLATFVAVNLFVAVILEGFEGAADSVLTDFHLEMFRDMWYEYDPKVTQTLDVLNSLKLLRALPYPMGFNGADIHQVKPGVVEARMLSMDLKLIEDFRVGYMDVASALATLVVREHYKLSKSEMNKIKDKEEKDAAALDAAALGESTEQEEPQSEASKKSRRSLLIRQSSIFIRHTNMRKVINALKIQRVFRKFKQRKAFRIFATRDKSTGISTLVFLAGYMVSGWSREELEMAATRLQSAYRKRTMRKILNSGVKIHVIRCRAAMALQDAYRKRRERKKYKRKIVRKWCNHFAEQEIREWDIEEVRLALDGGKQVVCLVCVGGGGGRGQ